MHSGTRQWEATDVAFPPNTGNTIVRTAEDQAVPLNKRQTAPNAVDTAAWTATSEVTPPKEVQQFFGGLVRLARVWPRKKYLQFVCSVHKSQTHAACAGVCWIVPVNLNLLAAGSDGRS